MPSRRDLSSGGVTYGKCQLMQPALLGGFSTLNLYLCVSFQEKLTLPKCVVFFVCIKACYSMCM